MFSTRLTELMVDNAWDAERRAHNCARDGTMTERQAQLMTARAVALDRALLALQRADGMALATAQKWIARYAPVNVDELGYEAAYVGAIRH